MKLYNHHHHHNGRMGEISKTYINTRIKESLLFSEKTLAVDLNNFTSGKKNKLLVIGYSGSGKTTVGRILAKNYQAKYVGLDEVWGNVEKQFNVNPEKLNDKDHKDILDKIDMMFYERIVETSYRCVIEGINIVVLNLPTNYQRVHMEYILQQPCVIMGRSAILSGLKGGIRNFKRNKKRFKDIYTLTKVNIKYVMGRLEEFKKRRLSIPNTVVEEIDTYHLSL
ncbi:MAG: hypothetical protein ACOCZ5_01750 [bacterium]